MEAVVGDRAVTAPVEVRDAALGAAVFTADLRAVGGLLPAGLTPFVWRPGRGALLLAFLRYFDGDLGAYDEVVVAAAARPVPADGAGPVVAGLRDPLGRDVGGYVVHLPVTDAASREAGERIWGFPKVVDDLDVRLRPRVAGVRWVREGREVLRLTVPHGGRGEVGTQGLAVYSLLRGRLQRTPVTMAGSGVRAGVGGARLELGSHPVADDLRSLGLSRHALLTASVTGLRAILGAPSVLAGAAAAGEPHGA